MSNTRETNRRITEEDYRQGRGDLADTSVHEELVHPTAAPNVPPDRDGERAFVRMVHAGLGGGTDGTILHNDA